MKYFFTYIKIFKTIEKIKKFDEFQKFGGTWSPIESRILIAVRNFSGIVFTQIHVPLLKSIRKAAVSHESVEGSRRGLVRRDERTKKLIRLSWKRWSGRTATGKEETTWFEKARRGAERWDAPEEMRGRLRGVKGGSNEKREPRRIGGRVREEHRLIDSGGLVWLCLQHRFFRCSARAHTPAPYTHTNMGAASTNACQRLRKQNDWYISPVPALSPYLLFRALNWFPESAGWGCLTWKCNESGFPPLFMTMKFKRRDGWTIRRRYRESVIQFDDRKIKEYACNWFATRREW